MPPPAAPLSLPSRARLRQTPPTTDRLARVLGAGLYAWMPGDARPPAPPARLASAVPGHRPGEVHAGRWVRLPDAEQVDIRTFGAVDVTGGGTTESTDAVQRCLDALAQRDGPGAAFVPEGTFLVANVQLRSGVDVVGAGAGAVLRLPDPEAVQARATNPLAGGTKADRFGAYPTNVLATTLTHNAGGQGGADGPGRTRARDPEHTDWHVQDVTMARLTIDGAWTAPWTKPPPERRGQNVTAMGAGIHLANAGRITVRDVQIRRCRLDGLFVGYDEVGGGDLCTFADLRIDACARTGVAQIAGRGNTYARLTITAGPHGFGVAAFDVEANLDHVINREHLVHDSTFEGRLLSVCRARADQRGLRVHNVQATGLTFSDTTVVQGTRVTGCTFEGDGAEPALVLSGFNRRPPVDVPPLVIEDCTFTNVGAVVPARDRGGLHHVTVRRCRFEARTGAVLTRPYRLRFLDNDFTLDGGEAAFDVRFGFRDAVAPQGAVEVRGNTVRGTLAGPVVRVTQQSTPPATAAEAVRVEHNRFDVTTTSAAWGHIEAPLVLRGNAVYHWKPLELAGRRLAGVVIADNDLAADDGGAPEDGATALTAPSRSMPVADGWHVTGNRLHGVTLALLRPRACRVEANVLHDAGVRLRYLRTDYRPGATHVRRNQFVGALPPGTAAVTLVTAGPGVAPTDWSAPDVIAANVLLLPDAALLAVEGPRPPLTLGVNTRG